MPKAVFDSIEALRGKIGQEVAVGDWSTVTQEQINLFADATGDHQWIHLDTKRAAAESPYGTTIAHGFLTLSLIPRLMADALQLPKAKMSVNYGLNRVRF
ncbi:MAG: MaoC family dehydratase, partial [Desulfobacterales bacterium]|nr:MaoC family dehydratase [Desulfobacterales bacterium]